MTRTPNTFCDYSRQLGKYTGFRLQRVKDSKETARGKWVLIVIEVFNITVN